MIVVVASVFIETEGRVMLVRETKAVTADKYGLPGGKLEEGESLEECAVRECLEETGYQADIKNLILVAQKTHTHEGNTVVRFIFSATAQKVAEKSELELTYLDKDAVRTLLTNPDLVRGKDVCWLLQMWLDNSTEEFSNSSFGLKLFT